MLSSFFALRERSILIKLCLFAGAAAASVSACKPRQQQSDVQSLQTLHMGGLALLWHADDTNVYVRACNSPITDTTIQTATIEEFRTVCPLKAGTKEVTLTRVDFVKVATDSMMNDLGFKDLLKQQASINELDRLISLKQQASDVVSNANAAQKIFAEYETISANLQLKKDEAERMEAVVRAGVQAARGSDAVSTAEDFQTLYGDAHDTVQTDLKKYNEDLSTSGATLSQLVTKLKESYELYVGVGESLKDRFSKLAEELTDPKIQILSALGPDTLNYAIFSAVATRYGLFGKSGDVLPRPTCVPASGVTFNIKGADGNVFVTTGSTPFSKSGCESAVNNSRNNLICVLHSKVEKGADKDKQEWFFYHLYDMASHSRLTTIAMWDTYCYAITILPNIQEYCDNISTVIVVAKDFAGKEMRKFDTSNDHNSNFKQCNEYLATKYPGFRFDPASRIATTAPIGTTKLISGFDIAAFLASRGAPVATGTTGPGTPTGTGGGTPTGGNTNTGTTNTPSAITMADVKAAMVKNVGKYDTYNKDTGAVDGCRDAGNKVGWTSTMQDYYCTLPIYKDHPGNKDFGERHCFTGTVREEGPYASLKLKGKYLEAANHCMGEPAFSWIISSGQKDVFIAVMGKRQPIP